MKKALFIDRDGTIIMEPPVDYQVDSLDKLSFYPFAISSMASLSELDFELVMVTNQDGLGTDSFPEETFHPAQNKMLETLAAEGVTFDDILIDRSFPQDNAPTRKPQIGMLTRYMTGDYDLAKSYVIGDRITDIMLAANLGAKGILLQPKENGEEMVAKESLEEVCVLITDSWREICSFIRLGERSVSVKRTTRETDIALSVNLDSNKNSNINSGLKFFDHMLDQIVHHAGIGLNLEAKGDLCVDEHHTIEDVGIALGDAISQALGNKVGINRYGFALPMDECSALVLIDFGGRIDFEWDVDFKREYVGDVPTEMFQHFFKSMSQSMKCNLHISAKGENEHHKIEGIFKAFARALKSAVERNPMSSDLPSSKGVL